MVGPTANPQFGLAWVTLCVAFAIHVAHEALTDFLSVYNPMVRALRARLPLLPLPTFTFRVWLRGLVVVVVVLTALSPFAWEQARWIRPVASAFAAIMLGNGVVHLMAALYRRRVVSGARSAPLLIAGAIYLLAVVP